ncbi:ricin B lectin domain-containing protein [Pilaira anomala]|nr:ricin B lectin domain-containing protein [Pilaira anomala]
MTSGPLYYIKSKFNGRVIDVRKGSTEDEAKIIVYTQKKNDCKNQLWSYENGYLINAKSGKALDIDGGKIENEADLIQYSQKTSGDTSNQKFGITNEGHIYVQSQPDLVLDIKGAKDEDEVPVILYKKREGEVAANQRWTLEPYNH